MEQRNDTDTLVTENIPLVGHLVREMVGKVPAHVSRDDLTSAGLAALVQAAHAFDPERGVPFGRYAATRVRGALVDELRSVDWASRAVRRRARDLDDARHRMAATLGRVPNTDEVASALGMSVSEVVANDDDVARAQVLSLQGSPEDALEELLPADGASPEELVEHRERLTYVIEAVAELPERLRTVVTDYFLNERPMTEIAAEMGVTESRVSQMRAEALALLREALNRELDPELVTPVARPTGCAARRREAYFAAVSSRHAASLRRPAAVSTYSATA